MPLLELFDETLDINSTENYELSVQIGSDGLSLCILDTLRNKYVMIRDYEPDSGSYFDAGRIGEIISKDDFLMRQYKKVHISTPSQKSTIIPAPLYDDSKKDEYFRFNLIPDQEEVVMVNRLPEPDSFLLFTVSRQISDLMKVYFINHQLYHHLKPLLQSIAGSRRPVNGNYVHVHLENEYFNMIIFDLNTLKFCNTFKYKTLSDIQYYVFYVLKRLNISHEEIIHFSGKTEKYPNMVNDFSRYARNIKFAEPAGNFTFSYVFNDSILHKYLTLFTLTNCE
jgi:hypothetical protein